MRYAGNLEIANNHLEIVLAERKAEFLAKLLSLCKKFVPIYTYQDRNLSDLCKSYDDFFSTSLFTENFNSCSPLSFVEYTTTTLAEVHHAFEKISSCGNSKLDGVFYTPHSIVNFIVEQAFQAVFSRSSQKSLMPKFLDPACGSGVFILEVLKKLCLEYQNCSNIDQLYELIRQCLYGVDRDRSAVELTKVLVHIELVANFKQLRLIKPPDLSQNFKFGNSLIDPIQLKAKERSAFLEIPAFNWQSEFAEVFCNAGFDCIIGNPPYGLKRGEQISEIENEVLKRSYLGIRDGKVNKYLLFLAKGYELLKPGGVLSYIIPNAWLGIKSATSLRNLLLKEGSIENICVLKKPVFDSANVETVIVKIVKKAKLKAIRIIHRNTVLEQPTSEILLSTRQCLSDSSCKIPLNRTHESQCLLDQLHRDTYPIRDCEIFEPCIALQAYAVGKGNPAQSAEQVKNHSFHHPKKISKDAYKYLNGSDIQRYGISWSGSYLLYGPWLAEAQDLMRFSQARILIREIIAPAPYLLSAALVKEIYLYNKSVLHIRAKLKSSETKLAALLALLNSKIASFIIKTCGRKSQRKIFPKLVIEDLLDFPIPLEFDKHHNNLAEQALSISQSVAAQTSKISWGKKNIQQHSEILKQQAQIDQLVFDLYKISSAQVKVIEHCLEQSL